MKFTIQSALLAGLSVTIVWQAWALSDVKTRLAAVEASVSETGASTKATVRSNDRSRSARSGNVVRATDADRKSRSGDVRSEGRVSQEESDDDVTVIQAEIEEAVERKLAERKKDDRAGWMSIAAQRYEMQVSEVGEEYDISIDVQNKVIDILVDGMHAGIAIREDIASGEITYAEAKQEGAALKEETAETVSDLIGEEAAEALWEDMKSGGGGWR